MLFCNPGLSWNSAYSTECYAGLEKYTTSVRCSVTYADVLPKVIVSV